MSNSETAAATEKPAKAPKIEQNGVTRPSADTASGRIWAIADELSNAAGAPPKRGDVLAKCESEGINVTTGATQFGRWCKFNGVKATPAPKAEKPKKEKKAKAAPATDASAPASEPAAQ